MQTPILSVPATREIPKSILPSVTSVGGIIHARHLNAIGSPNFLSGLSFDDGFSFTAVIKNVVIYKAQRVLRTAIVLRITGIKKSRSLIKRSAFKLDVTCNGYFFPLPPAPPSEPPEPPPPEPSASPELPLPALSDPFSELPVPSEVFPGSSPLPWSEPESPGFSP